MEREFDMENVNGKFLVIGGEYKNTRFEEIAEGMREEVYGPYKTYAEARAKWAERAWATVDNCHCRFSIQENE